ncbi:TPA: restriction endonuclease subunit S [Vibrio parahaemolyticus]|uniref:restriction endonuclease subunit S n=2 Tax=Vibrio parahaemolyticus TaxID=670 RepID=UPI0010DD0B4B|nr:restriction endonuclease subunit S [Vibrio parahaemolyticus]MBE3794025.1 restriction endonuclease subunit S [Vibrio parahaemolyticus]MBE4480189.1 restriction endonuclease subunit S [Vibrio parahaemolyticus]TBT37878.1 restriction endonuclease subunit S [Vibrio parahaemolyticus]TOZ90180.1 restriction endonuclease subunit S [Vibrio parahaemolyticus]HCG9620846.1 restriction endonuclease subunit S [Vibrio parahaemolyticus]
MSSLPKLRLSEFSDSNTYCLHKFDDMFSFSSGKNIKQNESSPEFSTPCVRYGELYHMYGEVITKTINKTNLEHSELTFSVGNEILLPSAGEDPLDIGSASALTLEGVAIGRTINVLRPKGTIDYSHIYVSYYINEKLRKRISQLARGASISNVYNSDLKTLKAYLPSLPEQQKIASFLSKVDEKVALLTEKKDKLTEYKKGVMQQLFNGKWESKNGQKIFIPPTLRFKADDGNEFPDWKEVSLGDVLIPTFREVDKPSDNYLAIGVRSHCKGTFQKPDSEPDKVAMDKLYVVKAGDLIVNITFAWEGAIAIVKDEDDGGYVSHRFPTYLFNEDRLLGSFFESLFKQKRFRFDLDLISPGGAGRNRVLSKKEFLKLTVSVPSINEQKKISEGLTLLQQKLDLANSELEKAKEWKRGLLQQMFV